MTKSEAERARDEKLQVYLSERDPARDSRVPVPADQEKKTGKIKSIDGDNADVDWDKGDDSTVSVASLRLAD